ncbi:MAG: fluoride efflux transporter CrcB [Saprospiraceae bacterium]
MSRILLLIGIGGFIGSIARYAAASWLTRIIPSVFPYGTFAVNITGCLAIGLIYGLSQRFHWVTPEWGFFLATGFCGGYTTFSTFAYENITLLQNSNYLMFAMYSIGSFAIGLLSVFAGIALARI